jgi:MFS family permease
LARAAGAATLAPSGYHSCHRLENAFDETVGRIGHVSASSTGRRLYLLGLGATLLVQVASSFATQAIPVLAPVAAPEFGLPRDSVGYFVAFVFGTAILSSAVGGLMVVRHGAVRVSQVALLLSGLSLLAFGVGTVWLLIPAALLMGAGLGPPTPASSQILSRVTRPDLASVTFSIKQMGVPLGNMIAGLSIPTLIIVSGWRDASWIAAALCVALAFALQPLRRVFDVEHHGVARRRLTIGGMLAPVRMVWEKEDWRRLAIASFVFTAMQITFGAFLVVYLVDRLGQSLIVAGSILSIGQLAGAGSRLLWGAISDRLGCPMRMLAGLGFGMAAGSAALAMADEGWSFVALSAASILYGMMAIGWAGVFFAELARRAPAAQVATVTGGAQFFTFAGALVVPPLFSLALGLFGSYALNFAILAIASTASGVALLPLARIEAEAAKARRSGRFAD